MATTIAAIAKAAMDAVALAVTDAIRTATLSYVTQGAYDNDLDTYAETITIINSGRGVIDTVKPIADVFPAYTAGPSDKLILLEGFTTAPQEGWQLSLDEVGYEIRQVNDIMGAGTLFYVIAIETHGEAIEGDYIKSGYIADGYFEAA